MANANNPPTDDVSAGPSTPDEAVVLHRMIADLSPLSADSRRRLINTICVFFGISGPTRAEAVSAAPDRAVSAGRSSAFQFSEDAPTVKQFMHDKRPQTDVERVACLAYYLAHYRGTPHVRTKDISELNKESAHRPFSNTAFAVDNATKAGYLVPSIKGSKQISAYGERFVETLPDREAAKEIMAVARAGRRGKPAKKAAVGAA